MNLRFLLQRLLSLFRHRQLDQDFEDEAHSHLDLAAGNYIASGMTPIEARRLARIEFGTLESAKDLHRDTRGLPLLDNLAKDLRYGVRQLRSSPTFTFAAVLSLGLGIGATTVVFGIIYGILLHPFPYRDAQRMIDIGIQDRAGNLSTVLLTSAQFKQLEQAHCIESAIAWQNWSLPDTSVNPPQDVKAVFFTPGASTFFGVPPALGRGFMPSDAPNGKAAEAITVLTWSFWHRQYKANPDILGKTLQLLHKNYTIVGVMPERFAWNRGDVYVPLEIKYGAQPNFAFSAKLKPGIGLKAADAELQALFEQFARESPSRYPTGFRVRCRRLIDRYGQSIQHTLYLLFGAVTLLLLVGCANTSILLLARGSSRRHELAVRAAIGASRIRIMQQLLTESLALSFFGALLGVVLAYVAMHVVVNWLPQDSYPQEVHIAINLPVLAFSIGMAVVTSLVFGVTPAFRLSRSEANHVMHATARKMSSDPQEKRSHALLVAGQIALTLLLLSAAGSSADAFARLLHANLGYDPSHVMDISIPLHNGSYASWKERAAYFDQLRHKVSALPEVVEATDTSSATPPFDGTPQRLEVLDSSATQYKEVRLSLVGPEYFSLLRIPLLRGRAFSQSETMQAAHLAVINQAMARRYWPSGDALGRSIRLPELKGQAWFRLASPGSNQWFQIIGVVRDVRNDGLVEPIRPAVYFPYTVWMGIDLHMLVRTRVPPLSVLHAIRAQIESVDSNQEVSDFVPTLTTLITNQVEWQQDHLISMIFGVFALFALSLAAMGLYSVVSYSVAQRTNEFGIGLALGASTAMVFRAVLISTSLSVGCGIASGVILATAFRPLLSHWVQSTSDTSLILSCASLLLALVAALAALFPARKAACIDPVACLRCQ